MAILIRIVEHWFGRDESASSDLEFSAFGL
jgi:hypothetical protein